MTRVTGIGGIFMKAKDPVALCDWYRVHLGIDVQSWGGAVFHWQTPEAPAPDGMTTWGIFPEDSNYFAPSASKFMVNYRVGDLHAVLALLRAEGCDVDANVQESEYGKFGWVVDPEGNKVELWEPPPAEKPA